MVHTSKRWTPPSRAQKLYFNSTFLILYKRNLLLLSWSSSLPLSHHLPPFIILPLASVYQRLVLAAPKVSFLRGNTPENSFSTYLFCQFTPIHTMLGGLWSGGQRRKSSVSASDVPDDAETSVLYVCLLITRGYRNANTIPNQATRNKAPSLCP